MAPGSDITVTFGESVDVTGAWFDLICSTSGAHTAGVSGGPSTFTIDPDTSFVHGDACTLTILAAMISDQDSNDPPDNMAADVAVEFSVSEPLPMKQTFIPYVAR